VDHPHFAYQEHERLRIACDHQLAAAATMPANASRMAERAREMMTDALSTRATIARQQAARKAL
jgi:hypothetical protein